MDDKGDKPTERAQPAFPKQPRGSAFAPHLRRAMREANVDNTRAVTGCLGTLSAATIFFFTALPITDDCVLGTPGTHRANAVVRWTFTLAAGLWAANFIPLLPVRLRKGLLWASVTVALGSCIGWLAVAHH